MSSSSRLRAALSVVAFDLSACGGGGGPGSLSPQTGAVTQPAAAASMTLTASATASTHALAPAGGITGTIALPAATTGGTIVETSSTSAPAAGAYTQSSQRTPQSGTLTFYFYASLRAPITVALTGIPGFSLTLPSTIPTAGRSFFYAISDPTVDGTVTFRTEGPATVSGQTVTFAATANPLTLQAGKSYVVTFYATSTSGTVGIDTLAIPGVPPAGGLWSFDIGTVDPARHAYYLADRTESSLDVVDTNTTKLVAQIPGFVGFTGTNATSGPDGVVPIPGTSTVYVGDGGSKVQVVDVLSHHITKTISTALAGTDPLRADEGSYDADDGIVAFANNADDPPFITFISTKSNEVLAHYVFTGAGGIEQSQYDPGTKQFFVNVVSTPTNPGGEVDTFDPATVLAKAPVIKARTALTNCNPTGMALGLNEQLLIGCDPGSGAITTIVLNATTGAVVKTIAQTGGADEVWFNPSNNRYYLAARNWTSTGIVGGPAAPSLGVIDAATLTFLQNAPTDTNAHSVAADPITNHIFVPLPSKGLGIYSGF